MGRITMKSKAIFVALLALAFGAQARPVSTYEAQLAAQNWGCGKVRLGAEIGASVDAVETLKTTDGAPFYAVRMKGGGAVFMSGDTRIEPVLAFSSEQGAVLDAKSPLWALLSADVSARQAALDGVKLAADGASSPDVAEAESKWANLLVAPKLAAAPNPVEKESALDDRRVSPLLKTKWGQSTVWSGTTVNCFNYYTPEYTYKDGSGKTRTERCVCGCVATAMAQLLRFWGAPTGSRTAFSNTCSVPYDVQWSSGVITSKTKSMTLTTVAGVYDWDSMVADPGYSSTEAQRKAIGKLTYDCGVAVGMGYDVGSSGISSLDSGRISKAFVEKFGYDNAAIVTSSSDVSASQRTRAILSNLDAGCPVLLCIVGGMGGHAVVADGYGFSAEADQYVHLNMGWQGQNDVWYILPKINVSDNPEKFTGFDSVLAVIYNVFPDETGEIVSGRVLDMDGNPVEGADVKIAFGDSHEEYAATTTSARGIYSFKVPASTKYELTAAFGKYISAQVDVTVGDSTKSGSVGDQWGVELQLDNPSVRIGDRLFGSLDDALAAAAAGDLVEIVAPTDLKKTATVGVDCTVTATDPAAMPVVCAASARLLVADGARLALSNVTFAGSDKTLVEVVSGGCVAIGSGVSFGVPETVAAVATEDAGGFEIADELTEAFAVDCASARKVGATFGRVTCDPAIADAQAAKLVCLFDGTGEVSGKVDGGAPGNLVWDVVPVPLEEAAAYYVLEGSTEKVCFRRLDRLFELFMQEDAAGEVTVVKDVTLTNRLSLVHNLTIRSVTGAVVSDLAPSAGFDVPGGVKLVVEGLGFDGMKGNSLFVVNGGELTLKGEMAIRNFTGSGPLTAAAVCATNGARVVIGSDAGSVAFESCANEASGQAKGGAIYAGDAGTGVELTGEVSITGCSCRGAGGGIYLGKGAALSLSGMLTVKDNVSGSDDSPLSSDVYCASTAAGVRLTGPVLAGSCVGVRQQLWKEGFANVIGLSRTDVITSAQAFFSESKDGLLSTPAADYGSLLWKKVPNEIKPVSPEEAHAHVVGASGNYYASLEDALAVLDGADGTIEIMRDTTIVSNVVIGANVTLKSDKNGPYGISRADQCEFQIESGAILTLENMTFSGEGATGRLFYVNGGELVFGAGVTVEKVDGGTTRNDGAIKVVSGGRFVMKQGARIADCQNPYVYGYSQNGRGGAVSADKGSFIRLEGGVIENCSANLGGGVFIGNQSTIEVGGNLTVATNGDSAGRPGNVYVPDFSDLYLIAPLTGSVGVTQGQSADPFVFGHVSDEFTGTDAELADSAHRFGNDRNGDVGIAVRNGSETLLVWSDALDANGNYVVDGKTYVPVSGGSTLTAEMPNVVTPTRVYTGSELKGIEPGHGFVITGDAATDAGDYTATLKPKSGFVWADSGTTEERTLEWSIAKADYDMSRVTFEDFTCPYDGKAKTLVIGGKLPAGVTVAYYDEGGNVGGNVQTNAGVYKVTAKFTGEDTKNYNLIGDKTKTLTITKIAYDLSGITFEDAEYVFDGTEKKIEISGKLPTGVTVAYYDADGNVGGNVQTAVGTYAITARFSGDTVNHEPIADVLTATLTIKQDSPGPDPKPIPVPVVDFAFTDISRQADGSWLLTISPVKQYCKYTLQTSTDLKNWTPVGGPVEAPSDGELAFPPVPGDEAKRFWQAVGEDGEKPAE